MNTRAFLRFSCLFPVLIALLVTPLQTSMAQSPAAAPDPAPPPVNSHVQYSGLVDGYYLFQTRNSSHAALLTGRAYDVRQKTPTLSMVEINVFQNSRPNGLGFKATLVTGDDTDINHYDFEGATGGKGEAQFKNIQQIYGTYLFGKNGSGADFGKFVTPFGYESIEASGNNNYSHSVPYGQVPTYHTGVRLYSPANMLGISGLVATAYVVRALYNTQTAGVHDDNGRPAYIGQLVYTDPKGKFTLTSTLGLARDKFDFAAFGRTDMESRETLSDNDFGYTLSGSVSIGFNYTYAKFQQDGGSKQTLNGLGIYYHQTLTQKTGFALRFSGSQTETDGIAFKPKPYEVTATYQLKPTTNFTTDFEYRHDGSNVANSFLGSNSQLTQKTQDTLTVAGIFQF